MISNIKRTSHHAVIITICAIWHQSLKSIHYRILLIFQTKKNDRFEGQNMGGIKAGMRLGFGKNSGKFYVAIASNPNNTLGSSYLR